MNFLVIEDAFVTRDQNLLLEKLNEINVYGVEDNDCPEPSMEAIRRSLEKVLPKSKIYVFTDDIAKDHELVEDVEQLIQERQVSISFFITRGCTKRSNPKFELYKDLALSSGGQVYFLTQNDIGQILQFEQDTMNMDRDIVLLKKFGNQTIETYSVGKNTTDIIFDFTGKNATVNFFDPDNERVAVEPQISLENVKIYQVNNPKPGPWKIDIKIVGESGEIKITEVSPISFQFGFATLPPNSIKETFFRPLKGIENFLVVELINVPMGYAFTKISIDTASGSTFYDLHESATGLLITDPFLQPDKFKVTIQGNDDNGNELQRLISTEIQPENDCKSLV